MILVGVAVVSALVFTAVYRQRQTPVQYLTARVERGRIAATVSATGTVNAVITVQVGSQVSGNIQKLFVDYNSPVTENQIIAQIDPASFETRVNQARAALASAQASVQVAQATVENSKAGVETARANGESAKANIEKAKVAVAEAKRTLDRNKTLLRQALIAQSDLDAAQTAYDSAMAQLQLSQAQYEAAMGQLKSATAQARLAEAQLVAANAQVEQAKAALQAAELDLAHTTIRSPVHGIVVSRNVDVGQTVAASLQAPTLFLIAQDLTMAVGAKSQHILTQFLLEAVVLSSIGGILGVVFGIVGAKLVSILAGWPTIVSADAIILAWLFSSAVGIFFGFYPARKAAHLDPIQAMRYE